ncbi:MAG: DUF928 domain-containing protein [Cyanobacteria bacterium CRU_2_1]|nr:DUF928 domain-containing protein [Cyanobacteria bacterium RU_5_0]NJR58720.1 DUF928 domain-containing protein [Cyanobacteria bacterium CRU_2_1]
MYTLPKLVTSLFPSALIFAVIPFTNVDLAFAAQSQQPSSDVHYSVPQIAQWDFIQFILPPSYQGSPSTGRARGGASRGNCPTVETPLTTLVPYVTTQEGESSVTQSIVGLTSSLYPTFWFYVPYELSIDLPAEFLLLDDEGNYLYTKTLTETVSSAGIIQVSLPTTIAPLEVGKTYRWTFQVMCEANNPIATWGEIQRVAIDNSLETQIEQSSPRDQAALYAANGIWYEALTTLANLRIAEPTNESIDADWHSFLESAGLADIADAPLLPCCAPISETIPQ